MCPLSQRCGPLYLPEVRCRQGSSDGTHRAGPPNRLTSCVMTEVTCEWCGQVVDPARVSHWAVLAPGTEHEARTFWCGGLCARHSFPKRETFGDLPQRKLLR